MGQEESFELESFLPNSEGKQNIVDADNVTGKSNPEESRRIQIKYHTLNSNPSTFNYETWVETVLVFAPNVTIKDAVDYAISKYPKLKSNPNFDEVEVYFAHGVPIDDLEVNVHAMFGPSDTMIITNRYNFEGVISKRRLNEIKIVVPLFLAISILIIISLILLLKE